MPNQWRATIVLSDVAGSTRPYRTNLIQQAVRKGLERVQRQAFADAGIDWDRCNVGDRGDGTLILIPTDVMIAEKVIDWLPGRLLAELLRHNEVHSWAASFQLRVAFHVGEVISGGGGVVSHAIDYASRLVDADDAKAALASSEGGVLAVIVSERVNNEIVRQDPALQPDSYRRIAVPRLSSMAYVRILPEGARQSSPEPSGRGRIFTFLSRVTRWFRFA